MIACASAPARKASVTNPARSECPPSLSTWAGVNPAADARRWIISAIASPGHRPAADRAGLVHRRKQGPLRVRRLRQPDAPAAVQHRLVLLPLLSPAGHRCHGGLPAQDR